MRLDPPIASSASPSSGDAPFGQQPRASAGRILLFCGIFFGLAVTEEVSNHVLPLTLHKLTASFAMRIDLPFVGEVTMGSAFVIGLILALNPFFGFVAQPLVGAISDRVWTRVGRRAFFIIVAAPVVALCLVSIPLTTMLWKVVVLVVVYQFFQDVLWGSDHPLLADLFPSRQRGLVAGALAASSQLGSVFVNRVGLAWSSRYAEAHGDERYGLPIYWTAALFQVGLVMALAFFLWERPYPPRERPRLTVRSYCTDFLQQPAMLHMGLINFIRASMFGAATGFLVLFGTQTLGSSVGEYANVIGYLPLAALVYVWIIGPVVDRVPRNLTLRAGFACAVAGYACAWLASTVTGLAVAFLIFSFAWNLIDISYKSLVADFYPREYVGQFSGAINIFFAAGRTLSVVFVGAIIGFFGDDYRMAWPMAMIAGVSGLIASLALRDPRSEGGPMR